MRGFDNGSEEQLMVHHESVRAVITDTGIQLRSQSNLIDEAANNQCMGCIPNMIGNSEGSQMTKLSNFIGFDQIIWCEPVSDSDNDLTPTFQVSYVESNDNGKTLKPAVIRVSFDIPMSQANLTTKDTVQHVLSKSYPSGSWARSILVLINPHGGQGKALNLYNEYCKPILVAAKCRIDVQETTYYQHAIDIVKNLDVNKYDIIACASGDGIPHEVLNGLYQREDCADAFNKLIITQLPCGSGNAMSVSTHGTCDPSHAALSLLKSFPVRHDLMAVTQGSGNEKETKLSFLSQTYGVIADADIGTEHLRFLGSARFDIGVALKVVEKAKYPCEIQVKYLAKYKHELNEHYENHLSESESASPRPERSLTEEDFKLKYPGLSEPVPGDWETIDPVTTNNLGIFYVGKMPYVAKDAQFFPAALPSDGAMDLVLTDSRTSFLKMVSILVISLEKGSHVLHDDVQHSKILAYRLTPKIPKGYISVDGESFPFVPLQVEVLPQVANLLLRKDSFSGSKLFSRK